MSDASPPNPIIERAAQRAAADAFFLGHLLSRVVGSGRQSRETLAGRLGCSTNQLDRLWLCRVPLETGASFRQDVERIAAFVGCDAVGLAQVIREASALAALRSVPASGPKTVLLAARDRPQEDGSGAPAGRSP